LLDIYTVLSDVTHSYLTEPILWLFIEKVQWKQNKTISKNIRQVHLGCTEWSFISVYSATYHATTVTECGCSVVTVQCHWQDRVWSFALHLMPIIGQVASTVYQVFSKAPPGFEPGFQLRRGTPFIPPGSFAITFVSLWNDTLVCAFVIKISD